MRIAVDTLPLARGDRVRGMGFYVKLLVDNLQNQARRKEKLKVEAFQFRDNAIRLSEFDILHYPYFDLFFNSLKPPDGAAYVVTVPDVIPLIYPTHYPPGVRGKINLMLQKKALQKAKAVITISETSKKDIIRYLGVVPEKVHPIYLASQFQKKKVKKASVKLPQKYVLYVGDANYNKNILRLAKACIKINTPLVMVGKQLVDAGYDKAHPENRELREFQEKYANHELIRALGFLKGDDFQYVWQQAAVYCQPSLYEGFGMPVVEAFEAGVPVVAARTQALVEVADGAAVYFDPYSIDDMASKILKMLESNEIGAELVKKGYRRGKVFSWEKTAKKTIKLYEKMAES